MLMAICSNITNLTSVNFGSVIWCNQNMGELMDAKFCLVKPKIGELLDA
jgi:hypothetical protein